MKTPKSPFAWPGGKRALRSTLLALAPDHRTYVEVFAGSAKLLFGKDPSTREVLNDLNGDVINFYRVAKFRPAALAELFEQELVHPGRFRELLAGTDPADELDRALRFAYLAWYSYGAKGEHFASSSAKGCEAASLRRSLDRVADLLAGVCERLRNVAIEQRDFADILTRYDAPGTWFYLDPPYVHFQANGRYEALTQERRTELFALLARLKGKFLLSFDHCEEVGELVAAHEFHSRTVDVGYVLGNTAASRAKKFPEVLIANYPLDKLAA